MAAVRHHIVSAFLLERFSRDTKRGRLVAMLEKKTGKPTCVSPRDAGVRRHFYSIDIDDGRRDPGIEEALSKIESIAAPLVRGVEEGDFPVREHRLELAMFIAVCWLRTPAWREEMESLMEGTRERVADPAEATELLEALESDQALWATALYAGLRNGELRGLRIEDVDLEAGTISVQRSWDDVSA